MFYFVVQSSLKMNSKDYLKDISDIKNLMNKSSKFIFLSGLSGVMAGIYALIGASYFYFTVGIPNSSVPLTKETMYTIAIIILVIGFLSATTSIFFTSKRAKKINENSWNPATKNLLSSFLMPLCIGLIFVIILFFQENYTHLIALILLFYGVSLINCERNTQNIIKPLGILQVISGILCTIYYEHSFWFFTIGFGMVHLIYGTFIFFKYDNK
jgi:formate/nitrite transporter FocA (FNT family)